MHKRTFQISSVSLLAALAVTGVTLASCGGGGGEAVSLEEARGGRGQQIFRHDTFGDEIFWSDVLRMHEVIEQAVSPNTALLVGLKVDA
ncbi:MAG TPA: hypothetical protein VFB71_15125, partial [Ramlibacter sp.]|nr:hypothetical protein [Ramlibacter sp.]